MHELTSTSEVRWAGRLESDCSQANLTFSRRQRPRSLILLFTWRREICKAAEAVPVFVPAVVAPEPAPPHRSGRRDCHARSGARSVVRRGGVRVTTENGASPATVAAVLGALKAGS